MVLMGKANEDAEDTNRAGPEQQTSIRIGNVEDSVEVFDRSGKYMTSRASSLSF